MVTFMTQRVVLAGVLVTVAVSAMLTDLSAAGKSSKVLVTTTIADSQNGSSLRVASDTQGAYVTTFNRKQEAVSSSINRYQDGTDWMLTTDYSVNQTPSNRTVFFDLSEPATPGNPVPPITMGNGQAHLIAKCHLVSVDMYTLSPGASADCPGSFRFQVPDGSWYRLSFQPDNFPNVNRLRVTCISADSAGCKVWTITPASSVVTGTDSNVKSRNKLLLLDGNTEAILADFGDYYLSFSITVAR